MLEVWTKDGSQDRGAITQRLDSKFGPTCRRQARRRPWPPCCCGADRRLLMLLREP